MRMRTLVGWVCVAALAAAVSAFAEGPAAPQDAKPSFGDVLNPRASVAADPNALAELAREEEALMAQARDTSQQIVANQRPLASARQQAIAQDKDLLALSKEIAAKQRELEAKLVEKYPDVAIRSKEGEALEKQYSSTMEKLRAVRKNMDAIRKAIEAEDAKKKTGK